ncbi:MAG: glycosyltransferase [Flavobacteriaceae bacterium]|nr:MAG: glycosyltransferase [Flavobacteriaceae bacterium]
MTFLPPKLYAKISYEYFTGKKLNLDHPEEFNAKIYWYKVFYHPKILNVLVDKYAVKEFVKQKIGEQYLNETYAVYDKAEDVNFEELPNKFVIKGVHASGYNLIVEDKSTLNIEKVTRLFKKWQRNNQYYRTGQEWAYKDVAPRIMAEKFMDQGDGNNSLIDYKFYCFNGEVKFVEVHLDRVSQHKRGFYDLDFNKLPFRYVSLKKSISEPIDKPSNYDEMIKLSRVLSKDFPFVRVDFYSIQGKTVFGEMTFYPSDGRKDFIPEEYNKIIGDYFTLPKIPEGEQEIKKWNC